MEKKLTGENPELYMELMNDMKIHDYSYMMSDDNRYYVLGIDSEKRIKTKLDLLISVYNYNVDDLLDAVLNEVPEGFIDGLTHKVIRNWFKYI